MMKNLIIIGARGFGREIYNLAMESIGYGSEFQIKGYLDDKSNALQGFNDYPPIISSVEDYEIQPDDVFICALGDVNYKYKYSKIIQDKGGIFINIIHKSVSIGSNTTCGVGCIFMKYSHISCDVKIGNFVTIQCFSGLGHDVTCGNYVEIESGVKTGGGSQIGDFTTIHPGAIILPHKKIGNNSIVGVGAVVIRNVKEGITVMGNPAKELKY